MGSRMILILGVALLFLLTGLTQTSFGRERVLRTVLDRVAAGIRGEITVAGISSPGLLRGFTFQEVTIRGEDGRVFLEADSIRTGISGPSLLRGDLVFTGVHLWRPRITLRRLPGQDRMNVVSIFVDDREPDSLAAIPPGDSLTRPGPPPVDSLIASPAEEEAGSRRTIILRGATLHQGSLDVLLPLGPGRRDTSRILVEPGDDGLPTFRRLSFRDIDLRLAQAVLRAPGQHGERFEVEQLAFLGEVWPESFRLSGAEGNLRREGSRLLASWRSLELPGSKIQGQMDVRWGGEAGLRANVQGSADPIALEDFHFIENRLPAGNARGPFGLELSDEGVLLDFQETEVTTELGGIRARGGLFLGREIGFRGLAMEMTDLDLAVTDPWVADTLPLRGRLQGDLTLGGDLHELEAEGVFDLVDPDSVGVMTVDLRGRMGFVGGISASSLDLTVAPFEWGVLASLSPAMRLRGPGSARLTLTGSLEGDGLGIDGEFTHFPRGGAVAQPARGPSGGAAIGSVGGASRVTLEGWVRKDSTDVLMNLTGELSPLSLTTLRRSFPSLPFEGEYTGLVDLRGSLPQLDVEADLQTSGGPLSVRARIDARRPAESYVIEAESEEDFVLSNLVPSLPEPTRITGRARVEGRGASLDALRGEATIVLGRSEVGSLQVDSAVLEGEVRDGLLSLRELVAETGVGRLEGEGSFGVTDSAPDGELTLDIQSESLEPLRPFLMEDPGMILDTLDFYQRKLQTDLGTDLDTLATAEDVAVGGSLHGTVILRGGVGDFTGEGTVGLQELRFRSDYVQSAVVTFSAEDLLGKDRRVQADVLTDSMNIHSLAFRTGSLEGTFGVGTGRVRVTAARSEEERYSAQGTFALDSLGGGSVNLDELTFQFDTVRWNLGGPASFLWDDQGYQVRDFRLIRPGEGAMRVRVDGLLPLTEQGEGNFELQVERLDLSRLARAIQMETALEGRIDFQGRVTGPQRHPRIDGTVFGEDLAYGDFSLGGVESELAYEDERVDLTLSAFNGDRQVLAADGFFPVDLRLRPDSARWPNAPIDLAVTADSFPADLALAFMESMEEVQGTLSGRLRFGGTSSELDPSGDLFLTAGSALLPALGVRHRNVEAHLVVRSDRVVEVDGSFQSEGTASVKGTVGLAESLSDPELDLSVQARNFLAVNRRDVQARLSDSVHVGGTYRRPQVEGNLTVEQGVLMVEEIARSVEVVDLSDPAFFDVVDTTLVTLQPVIRSSQNPFLQNLRLDVDLTMAQDSWLRGREMNVEMAGNLWVGWDRTQRNLAFLGVLDATRGVYTVFGRQFQVQEGTVSFPGTPGINPDLDIRAMNRVRTSANLQLEILAQVEGSLLEPRVSLSSNASFPVAESDLVSYLVFGQPSYATSPAQSAYATRAAGASLAVGLFSSELGSILAKDVGLDYLAVTQGRDETSDIGALAGTVYTTQVEIGQYLTEDIFAALHWRPLSGRIGQQELAALRIEGRLSDRWTLEGYWEDRFYRNPIFLLGTLAREFKRVYGFLLYREWGY